ncbi:CFEM domain containing protein [Fonsecaea pedrosoi]|nr:CFEM domain containing protein [Fonsecaea pedrosoi]
MRFLSFAVVGLSSLLHLAASQDLSSLPACAVTCAVNAISSTGCAATDAACVCQASSFLTGVYTCISGSCSADDIAATLQFAQQYCGSAGISITLPTASATAAPTSTPSSAASSPATAPASVTSSSVPASGAPAATFTGGAQILKQQWAGVAGVIGLGVAAVL